MDNLDGLILVVKPPSMTSHQLVAEARRMLRIKRIGHTGTLDPDAAGLMILMVGQATRLAEYITGLPKFYRAEMVLGITTSSQDASGDVTGRQVPLGLTPGQIEEEMTRFRGQISQTPPMVSAVHHEGRRLYELARRGIEVERESRWVEIYELNIIRHDLRPLYPRVLFDVFCSKGTYIRTLCADIGAAMGCGAHLSFLVRTSIGQFSVDEAWTLEELSSHASAGDMCFVLPMQSAVAHMPSVTISNAAVPKACHGHPVSGPDILIWPAGVLLHQQLAVVDQSGDLVAVGMAADPAATAKVVLRKVLRHEGS